MSSTVILLLGAGLVFVAFTLALSVIGVASAERRGVARSIGAIQALDRASAALKETELERPFAERVLGPLGDRFINLGRKMARADTAKKLQFRLDVAGNHLTARGKRELARHRPADAVVIDSG